jgi:hypothetical protein
LVVCLYVAAEEVEQVAATLALVDYIAPVAKKVTEVAAGPTDLADQAERPKVVVAGIEIDFLARVALASSAVDRCLVDIVT